jgi:hypothetical protein
MPYGFTIQDYQNYGGRPMLGTNFGHSGFGGMGSPGGFAGQNQSALTLQLLRYLSSQQSERPMELDAQTYLHGVATGTFGAPEAPVYLPGFSAPKRTLFARRGYYGPLNPGDQIKVHDGETITRDATGNVAVIPGEIGRRYPGALVGRESFRQTRDVLAGDLPGYMATSPAARQAATDAAMRGERPFRDRQEALLREKFTSEASARLPAAQNELDAARRVGESDSDYQSRIMQSFPPDMAEQIFERGAGYIPTREERLATPEGKARAEAVAARRAERERDMSERRKALGFSDLDNDENVSIGEVLTQRSQERRAAVEMFGTSRPRAIGAMREVNRQRGMEEAAFAADLQSRYGVDAETAAKIARDQAAARKDNAEAAINEGIAGQMPGASGETVAPGAPAVNRASVILGGLSNVPSGAYSTPTAKQNYRSQIALAHQALDDIEELPESERKEYAAALLNQITSGDSAWGGEVFYDSELDAARNALRSRLESMAGTPAPQAPKPQSPLSPSGQPREPQYRMGTGGRMAY